MSDQVPSTKAGTAKGQKAAGATPVVKKRRGSMFDDPIVRAMAWIAGGLVILYLATVVGALFFGIIGSPVPRTGSERSVDAAKSVVDGGDHSALALGNYANALIDVSQFGEAQRVIDSAPQSAFGGADGNLEVSQARLYLGEKNYAQAITAADKAMKVIDAYAAAQNKKAGLNAVKAYGISDAYYDAALIRGIAQQAAGKYQDAVASYDIYLKKNNMESSVYVRRGDSKAALGDKTGAAGDYKAALTFVPDDQNALDGLKKIGVTQ